MYVDNIVITGNDVAKGTLMKSLSNQMPLKFKYFLGIEVTQSKEDIVVSQRKYALDILEETSMTGYRPLDSPMDPNKKQWQIKVNLSLT